MNLLGVWLLAALASRVGADGEFTCDGLAGTLQVTCHINNETVSCCTETRDINNTFHWSTNLTALGTNDLVNCTSKTYEENQPIQKHIRNLEAGPYHNCSARNSTTNSTAVHLSVYPFTLIVNANWKGVYTWPKVLSCEATFATENERETYKVYWMRNREPLWHKNCSRDELNYHRYEKPILGANLTLHEAQPITVHTCSVSGPKGYNITFPVVFQQEDKEQICEDAKILNISVFCIIFAVLIFVIMRIRCKTYCSKNP